MIPTGDMDRRIVIQQVTVTKDSSLAPIESWTQFAKVWAKKQDFQQAVIRPDSEDTTVSRTRWTIRYLPNLLNTYRVSWQGQIYRIIGTSEVGRQEGIEILTERVE